MDEPKTMTAQECGNQHGYLCPKCKSGESLYISATVTAALLPDGCDTTDSDTEWETNTPAWCGCGWAGVVAEFKIVEIEEEEPTRPEIASPGGS